MALKRDIPLVQRFNHLIVKYVPATPFGQKVEGKRSERDEHEGLSVGGLCIDYSFSFAVIKHTKANKRTQKTAVLGFVSKLCNSSRITNFKFFRCNFVFLEHLIGKMSFYKKL